MTSTKQLVGLLIRLLTLIHPLVGNGPGPDTQYSYSVTDVNLTNGETVENLY